jgi:hypothetical protein
MRALTACFFAAGSAWFLNCGSLMAQTVTLPDLPRGDTDTIFIQLDPVNGAVDGLAGATVGWGFTVDWTSTFGDWVSFSGSSLGSVAQPETNPSLSESYTDFIGPQGGPVDFALSPGASPWTEDFDGISNGVGAYQIVTDIAIATPGAQDNGEITFDFQVYNGDPLLGGVQIGDSSYSYFGASPASSVQVDAFAVPEPASLLLIASGFAALGFRGLADSSIAGT